MVKINYCPKCGSRLNEGSLICPVCKANMGELLDDNNSNEFVEAEIMDNEHINVNPGDEIVIVVPDTDDDEIVIDFDELGIDLESLDENVNIVIQVEGEEDGEVIELFDEDDDNLEANEWYYDDDPYGIVYYEYPDFGDD